MEIAELQERINVTRKEGEDLVAYLDTLSDEQWKAPSACEEWSVADVVGHLVYVLRDVCYGGVSRGLKGDTSTPEGFLSPGNQPAEVRSKFMFNIALRYSREIGPELLPTFKEYLRGVCDLWETLTPNNWDTLCYRQSGFMPAHTFTLTPPREIAMHHWDIRSRLDEGTAYLSSESMKSFMERILHRPPITRGEKLTVPLRYRFNTTSLDYPSFDLILNGDSALPEVGGTAMPDAEFTCDLETLVLLMYGRLTPTESFGNGKLTLSGHEGHLGRLGSWFKGV